MSHYLRYYNKALYNIARGIPPQQRETPASICGSLATPPRPTRIQSTDTCPLPHPPITLYHTHRPIGDSRRPGKPAGATEANVSEWLTRKRPIPAAVAVTVPPSPRPTPPGHPSEIRRERKWEKMIGELKKPAAHRCPPVIPGQPASAHQWPSFRPSGTMDSAKFHCRRAHNVRPL